MESPYPDVDLFVGRSDFRLSFSRLCFMRGSLKQSISRRNRTRCRPRLIYGLRIRCSPNFWSIVPFLDQDPAILFRRVLVRGV